MWQACMAALGLLGLVVLSLVFGRETGPWLIPALVAALVMFGALRRVRVYETLVEGAGEGFPIAVRIIPYLVAILVAIGMFRASGAMDAVLAPLTRLGTPIGLPAEGLIMAVLRSLSGSGAYAYLASILNDPAIGPDSFTGYLASTIQGSTETTFYVLAVYCGAVGVRRMRHALLAGLIADAAGLAAAVFICRLLYV
jgi:spore maturation protein SpmB